MVNCFCCIQLFGPYGLYPAQLLCPWSSSSKNTGIVCHALLQGIFLTQESHMGLLHCRQILYCLSHQGSRNIAIVQFSRSVVSDSLRPHESQHARTPCPSPAPGIYSELCPLSRWCHPLLSPSPPAFNPSQHQGLFQWANSSHEVAKGLEFQLQHQSFQWTPRTYLLQDGLGGSPCSPRDSQESSPTPQFKGINILVLSFTHSPTLTSIHDSWKNHSLDQMEVWFLTLLSLLFNMLSRLVITFLPRSKRLLISWLQSPSAVILEPKK